MLSWFRRMGNCLKSPGATDDISLLRDSGNNSSSVEQLEQPPAYVQESINNQAQLFYPSPNVSRPASQLTEEEQVDIIDETVKGLSQQQSLII